MSIINIAGYKFIPLEDLSTLRAAMMAFCTEQAFKGTILLAPEGINLSLAGAPENMRHFKAYLQQDARFADMHFRESFSATQPFKFMRVKLRKETITMKQASVQPTLKRAPSISPREFKQWLDEKREITVLDTRNDYEVRFGTFAGATHFHLKDFSNFPEAAQALQQDKPVVMFCTGGIRCEKAALQLLEDGFPEVYQLDGGILNYFSEVGGAHYEGECFVFDQRIALNSALQKTGTVQCCVCQGPVTVDQQALATYVPDVSCPACV